MIFNLPYSSPTAHCSYPLVTIQYPYIVTTRPLIKDSSDHDPYLFPSLHMRSGPRAMAGF